MNIHSQTIYMLIYSQIVKMQIAKCILSTTPKKDCLLPYQIWEAHDIKEQKWQGGMMFFSETSAHKSYKACFSQPPTPLSTLAKLIIIQ